MSSVCSAFTAAAQSGEEARAEQLLRQGMQRREAGRDSEALELYRGPFLGDDQSSWAIAARRRIATLASHACAALDARKSTATQWYQSIGRMALAMAE